MFKLAVILTLLILASCTDSIQPPPEKRKEIEWNSITSLIDLKVESEESGLSPSKNNDSWQEYWVWVISMQEQGEFYSREDFIEYLVSRRKEEGLKPIEITSQ